MALTLQNVLSSKPSPPSKPQAKPYKLCELGKTIPANSNSTDDTNLQCVLNSISVQSDELLMGEEMWRNRSQQKHLSDNCLSIMGRSKSIKDTFPTVKAAKDWSVEKDFWLSYIPRQQRIWEYKSPGGSWEYWGAVKKRLGEDDFLDELQIDSRTGVKVPFVQRCQRNELQLEWEQNVIAQYDQKALANTPPPLRTNSTLGREKELALSQTLARFRGYRKAINSNLLDVQLDTKHIDESTFKTGRRFQVEQMYRLVEGYKNLKWVYDLNPDLVESLAQQHLNGPAGKLWMNLSRTEVKKVLKLLKKGSEDAYFCPQAYLTAGSISLPGQTKICPRPCPARSMTMAMGGVGGGKRPGAAKKVNRIPVKKGLLEGRRLKPSQLMPLHVPGPDSLHQNVLIRPYTLDERERNRVTDKCGPPTCDNCKVEPPRINVLGEEDEEEGLTIESFAPFYRS